MAPYSDNSVIVSTLVALFIFGGLGIWSCHVREFSYLGICVFLMITMTPFLAWLLRSLVCNWFGEGLVWWWKFWTNH